MTASDSEIQRNAIFLFKLNYLQLLFLIIAFMRNLCHLRKSQLFLLTGFYVTRLADEKEYLDSL